MTPDGAPLRARPLPTALEVFHEDRRAGLLERRSGGRMRFTYASGAPRISVAMPVRDDPWPPAVAQPFFTGLLPDESLWSTIGLRLGRGGAGPYDLLALLGSDVAGALQLLPAGSTPGEIHWSARPDEDDETVQWLDDTSLAAEISALAQTPLGIGPGRRFSLAGAQEKLLVVRLDDGRLGIPLAGRPSTHILKPDSSRFPGSALSEVFCMELASRCGLETADVELLDLADGHIACITRFDRFVSGAAVHRMHQEDLCQALGVMPQDRYEDQGGPGLVDALSLLGQVSTRAGHDRLELLRRAVFNWLVGNADAHGKNHALLHTEGGVTLAPAYDIVCSEAFVPGSPLAMAIGGEYDPDRVQRTDWERLVADAGLGPRTVDVLARFAGVVRVEADELARAKEWVDYATATEPVRERVAARVPRLHG